MRNITKTLAVVSLLVPASAQPLGIGDIKLHSALNQKLNAEINLIVSADESASDIQVRLASPEKFDEAGVPWSYFLSQIKFNTVVQPNGSVLVKLSSKDALREPFLDFLLEVSWDKGNLYREFTVLIDPPAAYNQPVVPVTDKPEITKQLIANNKSETTAAPVATASKTVISTYGPVKRTDTLWKIAEKVMPSDDISIEQMMIALYKANPQAFYKDNVNALMFGQTLNVPDNNAILKLTKKQAAKLFKQQADLWKAKVKQADREKTLVTDKDKRLGDSQLELVAPVDATVGDGVVVSSELEQSVQTTVAKEHGKTADQSIAASEIEKKATEQAALNGDLQARLQKLEQQVLMMQKLLLLKDEQLAALQNKSKIAKDDKSVSAVKTAESLQSDVETSKPIQKTEAEPEIVKPEIKPQPQTLPEPKAEEGSFAQTYYIVVGGLGIALLGALGWLWWRKRKVEGQTDTESMFASSSEIKMPDSEIDIPVSGMEDTSAYDVGTVGESSFLSEFTPSDFDAFDTDQNEVDPISEADVYLAYGRYQQAEELIRQAIEDQPERNECKLKLLEIFYANENKEAFESYTHELVQAGMHNDQSFWAKVQEMAKEIIPDAVILLGMEAEETSVRSEKADLIESEQQPKSENRSGDDGELDKVDQNQLSTESTNLEIGASDDNLDFDLNDFSDVGTTTDEGDPSIEDIDTIDFDLDSFSKPESETSSAHDEEIESFDFDFGDKAADKEIEVDATALHADIEDNLEQIDFPEINEIAEIENKTIEDNILEDKEDDFNFDFDFEDTSLAAEENTSGDSSGVADLTDMDEFETKIDLAKAYIDMGDIEAAKTIAEEVLEKGNDQQKQTAQALLNDLK